MTVSGPSSRSDGEECGSPNPNRANIVQVANANVVSGNATTPAISTTTVPPPGDNDKHFYALVFTVEDKS